MADHAMTRKGVPPPTLSALALVLLAVLAMVSPSRARGVNSWPTYQHDLAHTGFNAEESELRPPLEIAWRWNEGDQSADVGVAVEGGLVYGAASSNQVQGTVFALNAEDGRNAWSFTLPNYLEGVGLAQGVTVDQELLYSGTDYIVLYALDAVTGALVWTFEGEDKGGGLFNGAPEVAGGIVYWSTDQGDLYALQDGNLKWRFDAGEFAETPMYVDGRVLVGSLAGFFALEAGGGAMLWEYRRVGHSFRAGAHDGELVYTGSGDRKLYALHPDTGEVVWRYQTGESILASVGIAYGKVYAASSDGFLYALDAKTGDLIWRQRFHDGLEYVPPAIANGYVYTGNGFMLEAFDAETGEAVWGHEIGAARIGPVAIAEGKLFVGDSNGNIWAFQSAPESTEPEPAPLTALLGLGAMGLVLLLGLGALAWRRRG